MIRNKEALPLLEALSAGLQKAFFFLPAICMALIILALRNVRPIQKNLNTRL